MTETKLAVGMSILFAEEKSPYKVQACNTRFAVCTKPFNPKKTVLYTIIDFWQGIRGTENLIFCMGFETSQLCEQALARLASGESEVSHRNRIPLRISRLQPQDTVLVGTRRLSGALAWSLDTDNGFGG